MNLVSFSIKTKGIYTFGRRLWTVFTRFGFSEARIKRALHTIVDSLQPYNTTPTFYIPAVVLRRHTRLIRNLVNSGVEIGIHAYVHNDYRTLSKGEQYKQIEKATGIFKRNLIPYQGFRNPYLGWTTETLEVLAAIGFTYESNEAVIHDVIDLDSLSPVIRGGFEKSLSLFQAIPCSLYTLRPHFEGELLRIPTCIPDDEMVFDRLRIAEAREVGNIWCKIMQRVYDLGGLYVLNLHPERGVLCQSALSRLLSYARNRPLPVWFARIEDIAKWWKERSQFRIHITPQVPHFWQVDITCTSSATLLGRNLTIVNQSMVNWVEPDSCIQARTFIVDAERCPCLALSPETPTEILDFLLEQGYPTVYCTREESHLYALYLDLPNGLGTARDEQIRQCSTLVLRIEQLEAPFLHFSCWPDGNRAALAISGDIDSVTVQDFFLRVIEVH
jgi:peptidoglycan/xylan/chitin deacetylase (PgdA/CDA1 family)